jgi:digeranylgeranylglycerophospholipid reductase
VESKKLYNSIKLSSKFYDVIIVGAGPAGNYAAYQLASLGHRVAVLEQKQATGTDICCTGIISPECFDSFGITPDVILTRANSAKFFAPSGECLKLKTEQAQAYVVDRASFDKAIADKANDKGADYFFSYEVTDITIGKDGVQIEALDHGSSEMFATRAVILANGFKPKLPQKLGLGRIRHFLIGAQTEIEINNIDEVELYFNQQIAPGSFAWLVPTSPNKALAGLLSTSQAGVHLQKFLLSPFCQGRIISRKAKIRQKAIPVGTLPQTYGDRVLVIGDAAGQVKPTTGGGIYLGHLGAKIATSVFSEALNKDELAAAQLSRYQKEWKAKMGREISLGYRARQTYGKLSNHQIERIFNTLNSTGIANAWLNSTNFSFDWHSKLVLTGLRYSIAHPIAKIRYHLPLKFTSRALSVGDTQDRK